MKKLLWIVGGIFILLVVAAISVPLFVSVDRYRPLIQSEVNKRINGKLELGALSLSLWGKAKVHADSIRLTVNGFSQPLVDTKQFHVEVPLWGLIVGAPRVTAVLKEPKLSVIKEADGRMNALELMKAGVPTPCVAAAVTNAVNEEAKKGEGAKSSAPATASAEQPPCPANSAAPTTPEGEPAKLPALLAGARLGLEIEKGALQYLDKTSKADYRVEGFDLSAQNLGLGSAMELTLRAPLRGAMPSLKFEGPLELQAKLQPILVGTSVRAARGTVFLNASGLRLELPGGKFTKAAGTPLTLEAKLEGNEKQTLLENVELRFHDYKVFAKGTVSANPVSAQVDLTAAPFALEKARELSPLLAEYDVKGTLAAHALVDFTPEKLQVNGDAKLKGGSVYPKAYLQAPLALELEAGFTESSLSLSKATVAGPDSDLSLTGSVRNFFAPQFSFVLAGKSFNLDRVLKLPERSAEAGGAKAPPSPRPTPTAPAAPGADRSPLAALAQNPLATRADGTFNAQIGKVTVYGSVLEQVSLRARLSDLQLKISEAGFRTFGGRVLADADLNLRSPALTYKTKGSVSAISAGQAFRTYFPKFQNTVDGKLNARWEVGGGLYPASTRITSLTGGAKLLAEDGALKSVDVQSTINSVMQKLPFLKDKKPLEVDDGFKTFTADVKFTGAAIVVEPIEMQPRNRGFVLKGKSVIQPNLEQETLLDVYDAQGRLPRDIQRPNKPALALRLTGPLSGPKTDYEYTVKKVAQNAGSNALGNVAGKAIDKLLGPRSGDGKDDGKKSLRDAADKLKEKFKLKF